MQYPINEMFQTLQGEGYFTGVPAIFIRLQGCPVGCAWCDTKHTWDKLADREVSLFSILAKTKESDKWGAGSAEDLLAIIGRQGWTARHVGDWHWGYRGGKRSRASSCPQRCLAS